MNIKVNDKFRITSDSLNFIIQEKKIAVTGKHIGELRWENLGYYSTIAGLVYGLCNTILKRSKARSVKGLIQDLADLEVLVAGLSDKVRSIEPQRPVKGDGNND